MLDRRSLLLAGTAALAGCASTPPATPDPAADAAFREFVERLGARSRASRAFLLRSYDPSELTPRGRVLYETLLPGAEADAALARLPWGANGAPYAVTHRAGAYRRASELREGDRPRLMAREVNRDTNRLEADARRGVTPADFAIDATITAVEGARDRVADSTDERNAVIAEALTRQIETLRTLRADATSEPSLALRPGGEEFYALALKFQLGQTVDPREAHERALARCRELQSEADVLLRGQGLSRGGVGERLRALAQDPRYHYPLTDEGKVRAVIDMNQRLARVRTLLSDQIEDAETAPGEVRRIAADAEASGTSGRRQGSVYFVDLGATRPSWTLPSVAHHEVLPGHLYQAPFEGAADPLDLQLRYAGGYSEGWATYAERLADEAGAFADDPLGRIGYLQWQLFRVGRIVVETGIHVMRWSREQAIEEMRTLQGESIAFVTIEEDVLRFSIQPGVYASQGLAAMHMHDLRERMRRRAGFDPMRFHTALLQYGPLSPPGLEQAAHAALAET